MKTFVFDIDGVLADFIYGFMSLAHAHYPEVPVYGTLQQKTWSTFAGMSEEQIAMTWKRAASSPTFWADLTPLISENTFAALEKLNLEANIYFATNRHGNDPLYQTKTWLESHGIYSPNVIVTRRKGEFCRVVDAIGAIDDKADNASAIAWISERYEDRTTPFLLSRPYNIYDDLKIGSKYVQRVGSVDEYIQWCFTKLKEK